MHRVSQLHLLPVALATIIFCTAVPLEFRGPVMWSLGFNITDFVLNLLLYAPLGLALWRRSMVVSLAGAAILSTAIEIQQIWHFERFGSAFDVLANVLGAACGVMLARRLVQPGRVGPDTLPIDWRLTAIAIVGVVVLLAVWTLPVQPSNLSNWNPDFDLLLGNERTSDRPWRGTISTLALVPAPLSRQEVRDLGNVADPGVQASLVERGAYVLSEAITLDGTEAKRLSPDVSHWFFDSAVTHNGFTLIAKVTTADTRQKGPARLISFSADQFNRNFDLGQEDARLVFRVRTLSTGPNGMNPHTKTPPVLVAERPIAVVATFDGAVARVYVDGQPRGRANLAAAGCAIPRFCDSDLPIASALLGALLAIVAVGIGRPLSRAKAVMLAILAGMLGAALFHLVVEPLPLDVWPPVMVLAGAASVGLATSGDHRAVENRRAKLVELPTF